jgi:hypothetical protein
VGLARSDDDEGTYGGLISTNVFALAVPLCDCSLVVVRKHHQGRRLILHMAFGSEAKAN